MKDAVKLQKFFQTLADVNRLKILKHIGKDENSVSQLVKATGLSQPLVSHHLRSLRDSEILETRRSGPFVYYKLKDIRLLDALGLFSEIAVNTSMDDKEDFMFCCPPFWKNRYKKKQED